MTRPSWSNEMELLLALARPHFNAPAAARRDAALAAHIDWSSLIALADRHGLLPLIHSHVTTGALVAPDDAAREMSQRSTVIARRNLELASHLLSLLRLLARDGIRAVPFKGPLLAQSVYGSIALRQFRDLDLLLHRADLPRVSQLFESAGYRVDPLPADGASGYDVAANSADGRVHVELHYRLSAGRGTGPQTLADVEPRLRHVRFMDVDCEVLDPEDELLYLCEHGAGHAWTRLEWIATVAELLRRGEFDRDALRVRAGSGGSNVRLDAAVDLSHLLFDDAVSAPATARVRRANAIVTQRLVDDPARILAYGWENYRFQSLTDPDAIARLRRAWFTFVVPASYDLRDQPPMVTRTPARYFVRPIALFRRWWRGDRVAAASGSPADRPTRRM